MPDCPADAELRQLYADALQRAMRHAAAHVRREEAREIAHHVATAFVRRATADGPVSALPVQSIDAFIHRAVLNRIRDLWRTNRRRSSAEQVWEQERGSVAAAWAEPQAVLESAELHRVVEDAIAAMPPAMRAVFVFIRRDHLSYKETGARLGIGVGTVHAHLSRANTRLRSALSEYLAASGSGPGAAARSRLRGAHP